MRATLSTGWIQLHKSLPPPRSTVIAGRSDMADLSQDSTYSYSQYCPASPFPAPSSSFRDREPSLWFVPTSLSYPSQYPVRRRATRMAASHQEGGEPPRRRRATRRAGSHQEGGEPPGWQLAARMAAIHQDGGQPPGWQPATRMAATRMTVVI